MSKVVKEVISQDIARRLEGVSDCVVANMVGLNSASTAALRTRLREKKIRVMVVKNSLARRATAGTSLAPAFDGLDGTSAVLFGGADFVSLVKEAVELDKDDKFAAFKARGGVLDGEQLSPEKVLEISKWPSREEQISMLVGQILGPGRKLASQLIGPAGKLAGQIKKIADGDSAGDSAGEEAPAAG